MGYTSRDHLTTSVGWRIESRMDPKILGQRENNPRFPILAPVPETSYPLTVPNLRPTSLREQVVVIQTPNPAFNTNRLPEDCDKLADENMQVHSTALISISLEI